MEYILFDNTDRDRLLPFTHTRPVADIRCGILTMRERWEMLLKQPTSSLTQAYLQKVFPQNSGSDNIYINGAVFANAALVAAINRLPVGHAFIKGSTVIAVRSSESINSITDFHKYASGLPDAGLAAEIDWLKDVWNIFSFNDIAIRNDYALITKGRKSTAIPPGVTVTGRDLFIEEGAHIYPGCIINAAAGPVYIAKDTEILEGTLIRGPLAVGEHAVVKMGAKLYGATTIGPGCKVGGEINNVVFFANSNKAHDGYLGNAVVGEWCNLGADTNCSNLKNNYDEIKIWDEAANKSVKTGLTFCGLLMGDHSKCGINTMFNTGTVAGVSCNIFGGGFPEKFIPSFSWGGSDGVTVYDFNRAMETANRMMDRRNKQLSADEVEMFRYIYDNCRKQQIFL